MLHGFAGVLLLVDIHSTGSYSTYNSYKDTAAHEIIRNSTIERHSLESKADVLNKKSVLYENSINTEDMSRTRVKRVSGRNSARLLSESESDAESNNSFESQNHSNHIIQNCIISSTLKSTRNNSHSSNHTTHAVNQKFPSPIDSMYDKFRWILFKNLYLSVISCITFDVWLLSRMRRSKKLVCLILLPLLLYLLYGSSQLDSSSTLFHVFSYPYYLSEKLRQTGDAGFLKSFCGSLALPTFSGISSLFSKLFVAEHTSSHVHNTPAPDVTPNRPPPGDAKSTSPAPGGDDITAHTLRLVEERANILFKRWEEDVRKSLNQEISTLQQKLRSMELKVDDSESKLRSMELKVDDSESKLAAMTSSLKDCCDKDFAPTPEFAAAVEKLIVSAFRNVMAGRKIGNADMAFFSDWLDQKFSTKLNDEVEKVKKERSTAAKLDQPSLDVVRNLVEHYMESFRSNLSSYKGAGGGASLGDLSYRDVQSIVKEALMLYDADKTGKADYALESGGGSVLGTRCSENFVEKSGKYSIFGIPLWSYQNTPRTAIQPDVQPGKCWAFKGSHGFLVIQLSSTILPTGFTLEHIPVSLSPTGAVDSAPKDFAVYGLSSEDDHDGKLLGKYIYDISGEPLQYFPVQAISPDAYNYVELQITSNHGHLDYTCLYRFRVHGKRAS